MDTALIGQYVDGKFDWIVSSNRRPEKHPLDTVEPQSFRGAFSGYDNRTMVIAGATNEWPSRSVYDLESGELVANLGYGIGRCLDGSGDLPVAYGIDRGDLMSAFVFDPTKKKPTVLIKKLKSKGGLGSGSISWKDIEPVFDHTKPEFSGDIISPFWQKGKLWILKYDTALSDGLSTHNPDTLRLGARILNPKNQ